MNSATMKKFRDTERQIRQAEVDYMIMGRPFHKPEISNKLFGLYALGQGTIPEYVRNLLKGN